MSPEVVRLLAVAGTSLLAGGVLGSYATSALLGGGPKVNPGLAAAPKECPECKCDVPPPPTIDPLAAGAIPEDVSEVDTTRLPGLPLTALNRARAAAQRQLTPCVSSTAAIGQGSLVVTLTVTATGGHGFIRDAQVTAQSGETEWAEACVMERAGGIRFDWSGADGQQTLKLPLRVGF